MPTLPDKVELQIGGKTHSDWSSYEIDSDLLVPADGFHLTLGASHALPPEIVPGAPVIVAIGGDTVLTGRIDEIEHSVSKGSHNITVAGRDKAASLLDCSVPLFTSKTVSLSQIATKILAPFGIGAPKIDADETTIRDKINVEPGDTAWDALARAAEANGLWPWFEPDGTLVIGGPDYSAPEVATLAMRKDGSGNNLISLSKHESIHGRYSELTVLGQTHGTGVNHGRNNLAGGAGDTGVTWYRPKIVIDHECVSNALCQARAGKLLADGRLNGITLTAVVKGHRIVAPGQPSDGQLWKPGQRIHVKSEPHGIDGTFFLIGRKFTRSRMDGTRTVLTLKEDGVWVLDAHPHKNRHRRGKNALPGQIIDIPVPGSQA